LSIDIACPTCGAEGTIKVAEDAGPPFTDMPRRTYTTDAGKFVLLLDGDPPAIECVACGDRFPRPL
jgi:hypothetical protein